MNVDGSGQRQLADRGPAARNPTVTPDGRSIVFEGADVSGDRIWRMDVDGGSAAPITAGPFDWDPVVTPDGRWVYYTSQHPDRPGMHKVSITGGEPSYMDRSYSQDAASDGRVLVIVDEPGRTWSVASRLHTGPWARSNEWRAFPLFTTQRTAIAQCPCGSLMAATRCSTGPLAMAFRMCGRSRYPVVARPSRSPTSRATASSPSRNPTMGGDSL